jgi:hypothetical protein
MKGGARLSFISHGVVPDPTGLFVSDTFMRAFARHFRAHYRPQFELTTDMQVSLLHLARPDMNRLPAVHR